MKFNILCLVVILCISCGSDFLEEKPRGILTPEIVLSSDGGIILAANNLPYCLSGVFSSSIFIAPYMGADDLTAHPFSCQLEYRLHDIFAEDFMYSQVNNLWGDFYRTILGSNLIISQHGQSHDPQSVIDDCLGQAYFYRALCYSFLTRIWGKVPVVTEYAAALDYSLDLSEVAEIYALIVSDLDMAEQLLPEKRTDGSYPGAKPTRGTAKSLLAQVYLTMAGWPLKQTDHYALAAAKAKEVMDKADEYGYEILPIIGDLWTWANNFTNREIVYGLYYNNTLAGGYVGSMASPMPTRPREEGGWTYYFAEIAFFKAFPKGPRKNATFQTRICVNGDTVPWNDGRTFTGHPYYKKYAEDVNPTDWWGSRTQQVIRYAEVLLTYAEAKAMSGGPDATAYQALNTIRNRAGLPDITAGLSAEAFRDSVVAERGWEFAGGENASRWFDLIRLELLEEVTLKRDPAEMPLYHAPTHDDYWREIPGSESSVKTRIY
jgi:starch-binding outer membrane protein, SusD/RagB family